MLTQLDDLERKQKQLRREARRVRESLTVLRRQMAVLAWAARTEAGMTLQDIADVLGVTRRRVHQMVAEVEERRARAAEEPVHPAQEKMPIEGASAAAQ